MKPIFEPIPFAVDAATWGESLFQPLVLKEYGVVVAGGPSALFLFRVFERQQLSWTIRAVDRITGFAAQGGDLYVQDGPVLSRWNLKTGLCGSAINLLVPSQRWTPKPGAPDWSKLHALPDALRSKQVALQRARRRAEWLRLYADATAAQSAGGTAAINAMTSDLRQMLGGQLAPKPGDFDAELARVEADAAALVFSAPVVRDHQIWGKAAGMVFVIAADGTLHPLDDTLEHLGTVRFDSVAVPALALAEYPTDADNDQFECRLYYVTANGVVRMLDGGALPPVALASWPGRGKVYPDVRVRLRILSGLLWGADAQGTAIFALPIGESGSQSLVKLPYDRDWRWLELRPDFELALASGLESGTLIGFARGANIVERWGPRPAQRPSFTTFLPQSTAPKPRGRPLCVLEFEQEKVAGAKGPALRWLVTNTVDAPEKTPPRWQPPAPDTLMHDVLEGWSGAPTAAPAFIRTQPSVSRQDAFVIARNVTRSEELYTLAGSDQRSPWRDYFATLAQRHGGHAGIAALLGDVPLPPLSGRDRLYVYAPGSAVTSEQAEEAWRTVDHLRALVAPPSVKMSCHTIPKQTPTAEGVDMVPTFMRDFVLRFGRGQELSLRCDREGWIQLPLETLGDTVSVLPAGRIFKPEPGRCTLAPGRSNRIALKAFS